MRQFVVLLCLGAPVLAGPTQNEAAPVVQADGPYRRAYADGGVAAEGEWRDGRPQGEWRTFHPDGSKRTVGEFNAGLRTGKWEFWWPNGQLAASGRYSRGLRDDVWSYWSEEGAKLEARSGKLRQQFENYPPPDKRTPATRRMVWETRDSRRDGSLRAFWPDGSLQCEGEYSNGVRSGFWQFWRIDGSLEGDAISGVYVDGVRSPAAGPVDDPFAIPEERVPAREPSVARVPRLSAAPGVTPSEAEQYRPWIELLVRGAELDRERAIQAVLAHGYKVAPNVINELSALDLATPEGERMGEVLVERVLRPLVSGRGWAWSKGEDARAANELAIVRWSTWCALAMRDATFWSGYCAWLATASTTEWPELLLVDLLDADAFPPRAPGAGVSEGANAGVNAGDDARPIDDEHAGAARITLQPNAYFAARARVRLDSKARSAIDSAARWLVAHQSSDGSWQPGSFSRRCGSVGAGVCDGLGEADKNVGVTGLALLALFASGDEPQTSEHAGAMTKAIAWLHSQQDPSDGFYGVRLGHSYVYGHAIATLAMVEAWQASGDPSLKRSVERAVAVIVAGRSRSGGWRYSLPSEDSDTSVTAWMVSALCAARDAGIDVPAATLAGAKTYLEALTDPTSGRTGYDSPGLHSARIASINSDFPADSGEAMTAAALYTRAWIDRRTPTSALAARSFGLLAAKPPLWSPVDKRSDFYYVYWASHAYAALGGKTSEAWQALLHAAVLPNQCSDKKLDSFGSFDPIDAWGFSGGRIQSTSMLMLALAAPARCVKVFSEK